MFSFFPNISRDDEDDSDEVTHNKKFPNLVTIAANPDGTCFIHSILKCSYPDYQITKKEKERQEIAYEIRRDLIPMLREENPEYPTLESVVTLVKNHFYGDESSFSEETKARKFIDFLQVCYNFEYIPFPSQCKEYTANFFDNPFEYHNYIGIYKAYLEHFYGFLRGEKDTFPRIESVPIKPGNRKEIVLDPLPNVLEDFIQRLKEAHKNISKDILQKHYELRLKLEEELKEQLYNPQNFGCPYVQNYLKEETLPEGMYSELPYNCYFFTSNPGMLNRFAFYEEGLVANLSQLEFILDRTRIHLGDGDIIPFIPGMFGINLIIINFEENNLINEYSSNKVDQWIVIANTRNVHFDACGLITKENKIQTLFDVSHPLIQTLLKSKETQGKINWNLMK